MVEARQTTDELAEAGRMSLQDELGNEDGDQTRGARHDTSATSI